MRVSAEISCSAGDKVDRQEVIGAGNAHPPPAPPEPSHLTLCRFNPPGTINRPSDGRDLTNSYRFSMARAMHRRPERNGVMVMSITGINTYTSYWPWQDQNTQSASGSSTTSTSSISNTGTASASSNMAPFMQAFTADLEAMLTQVSDEASTSASGASTTASATSATDPSQNPDAVHHHHHHHGQGGSMDGDVNQLIGEIGQSLQSGTLSTSQINQSASLLATDVMQALQSYGTSTSNTPASTGTSMVA